MIAAAPADSQIFATSTHFFPELLSLEGDVGGSAVIKRHLDDLLLFEAPETELRDVDTKEALEALKKR